MSDKSEIRRFSNPFDRKNAFIGRVPHVASLRSTISKLKDLDGPVLIFGEKGTGKSLYSRILHTEGQRGLKQFEKINCTQKDQDQLAQSLFDFGFHDNKMKLCHNGTIHLHEVWSLSLENQAQLLTLLKTKQYPNTTEMFETRVIVSTSRDLGLLASTGDFDPELYEMLAKATVFIEPLRRRIDDLELLIDYFLRIECKKEGLLLKSIAPKLMVKLKKYDWPGNVKELKLCVERAIMYNPKAHVISDIEIEDSASPLVDISEKKRMFGDLPFVSDYNITLKDRLSLVEREMIHAEIKRNNGNKSRAAKAMGISREALRKKLLMSTDILRSLNLTEEDRIRFMQEDDEFNKAA